MRRETCGPHHVEGGTARRLTSHPGSEYLPKVSPDGKWIAFAGDYDGNRDVFVMPVGRRRAPAPDLAPGGRRADRVDGRRPGDPLPQLARAARTATRSSTASPRRRRSREAADRHIVNFSIDPATGAYAFTRTGGGGTWKRYRGGTADDIWVGDPTKADFKQVTTFEGMDTFPMWHGGRIYFLCDQGGTVNIWSMKPDGTDRKQLTDFGTWDARWPSMDPKGRIVFMLAGDIHVYDPATGKEHAVAIDLPSERIADPHPLPEPAAVPDRLRPRSRGRSPGRRGAGRDLLRARQKEGVTLPLTTGSGAREHRVVFDPKGERVVYVTDKSGEEQIVTADAWGRGEVKEVTSPARAPFIFSPSGLRTARGSPTAIRPRRSSSSRRTAETRRRSTAASPRRSATTRGARTAAGSPTPSATRSSRGDLHL